MKKQIIVNCDDMGYHPCVNDAIINVLETGISKSVSVMATGPYFDDAIGKIKKLGIDAIGVHLVMAAEYERLPMKPVSKKSDVPSIIDENGNFFRDIREIKDSVNMKEIQDEVIRQIEKVKNTNIPLSHIDGHMFWYESCESNLEIENMVREIGRGYGLPVRIALSAADFKVKMFWDDFESRSSRIREYKEFLNTVSDTNEELIIHPANNLEQLENFTSTGERRLTDYLLFSSQDFAVELCKAGIRPDSWQDVLPLMKR